MKALYIYNLMFFFYNFINLYNIPATLINKKKIDYEKSS